MLSQIRNNSKSLQKFCVQENGNGRRKKGKSKKWIFNFELDILNENIIFIIIMKKSRYLFAEALFS